MTLPSTGWRTLLADTLALGVAFGFISVISYVYVVIAGRTLTPFEFGVFNVFVGVISISGFFATALQLAVTQAAVDSSGRTVIYTLLRATTRMTLPPVALLTIAAAPFASRIGASAMQVAACGLTIFLAFQGATVLGFVTALGRIRAPAGINLAGAAARLALGWLLMVAGAGVIGAVLGYLAHYALVLAVAWWIGWQLAASRSAGDGVESPVLRLELSTVATFVLTFAPFSLDQLLVQALAPAEGGDYAAVTTIAKLVFFVAYPIIGVAYPHMLQRPDPKARMQLLIAAVIGLACSAVAFAGGVAAFPENAREVVFGQRYPEVVPHLGPMAFGVVGFSISALLAHALVAWGNKKAFVPSSIALGVGAALFALRHDSLAAIVQNQLAIYALQLLLLLGLFGATLKNAGTRDPSHT